MAFTARSAAMRATTLATAFAAAALMHGMAFAQGASGDSRSTPGQTRDASTPGRAPTGASASRQGRDDRSTPGAATDTRSTAGTRGADERSRTRERPDDGRSRAPSQ